VQKKSIANIHFAGVKAFEKKSPLAPIADLLSEDLIFNEIKESFRKV
jgi:hypothetical protein